MQFYSDIVSSESDYEEEEIVDEVEETAPQIKSKWLATTESMDDEDDNRGISKESRSEEKIKEICFDLEQFVDNENWRDAQKHFDTALNLAVTHKSKFGVECEAFLETLSELSELPENVKTHPEMEENARSRNTLRNLKLLVKQVTEIYPKYEKAIEVMENGGEDEDVDDDDVREEMEDGSAEFDDTEADSSVPHDFDYFLSEISKSISSKEKTSRLLQRIATSSARNGFPALEASAAGMTAHALIMENTKLTFPISTWRSAYAFTVRCFKIVKANSTFTVTDDLTSISPTRVAVNGGLPDLLRLLRDKLAQMTQFSKHLEPEHFALPTYENDLAGLVDNVISYYRERNQRNAAISCASVLIDILGQRTQSAHDLLYPKLTMPCHIITADIIETIKDLHKLLHLQRDDTIKMRAACYVAYQFALVGRYHEAADFIRRCGVQDYLADLEDHTVLTPLSVLYNRVLAQIGLAAFYQGDIEQTYEVLGSLWSFDQPEVLIGQAMPYGVERMAAEIELQYRELLVPIYYRIPAQKLELSAMLSALAIDSVREAFTPYERSRLQRYFYQAITRRTQLTGKPALPHDQVAAAYHALKNGNYQEAKNTVWSMSAWAGVAQKEEVFERYCAHLREAALRIFCYSNRNNFSSYSVANLALKFEVSKQKVRDVINQMLTESSELIAYWDRDDEFLFIDRNNTTRLQHLLLGTADSVIKLAPYAEPRTRLGDDDNTRRMGNRNTNNRGNNSSNNMGNNNRAGNRYNMRAR